MALNRNFRTTYYKTLGVPVVQHIVDADASYHALFTEPMVNTEKLRKLALEVGISPSFRAVAWKVLCGVLPAYKCLWEMAERERQQMYGDLVDAARVLQLPLPRQQETEFRFIETVEGTAAIENDDFDKAQTKALIRLYHTYRTAVLCRKPLLQSTDTTTATAPAGVGILSTDDIHGNGVGGDEEDADLPLMKPRRLVLEGIALILENIFPDSVADQFWCLCRIVDVLDDADELELVGAMLSSTEPTDDQAALAELETHFIRALDCAKTPAAVRP